MTSTTEGSLKVTTPEPAAEKKISATKKFSMTSLRRDGATKTTIPKAATTTATTTVTTASPVPMGRLRIPEADPETLSGSRKPSSAASPIVIRRSNPGMIGKAKLNTIKITMTLVGAFLVSMLQNLFFFSLTNKPK
jgi:hypothetical protein